MCLPGTPEFGEAVVEGQKVWAPLRPKDPMTPFEQYLTSNTSEVVSILPMRSPAPAPADVARSGYRCKSRYGVDVALYVAMAALRVGVQQLDL